MNGKINQSTGVWVIRMDRKEGGKKEREGRGEKRKRSINQN